MRFSSRFFLYAPIGLFLCLAAASMAYWWMVAGAFDKELRVLKGHPTKAGITLDWSKVTISGFPFRIDADFDGLSVKGAGAHGPFAWTTPHFALHRLPYGQAQDVFEADGQQSLSFTDNHGGTHSFHFLPGTLRASAVRNGGGLARFDLVLTSVKADDFTAGQLQFHMRRNPDGKSINLMAWADALQRPKGLLFFGHDIKMLRLYASLDNSATFAPLLKGETAADAADAAWHQTGGHLRVTRLEVKSSNLNIQIGEGFLPAGLGGLFAPLY